MRRLALTALLLAAALPALAAEKPLKVAVNYFFPPFSWTEGGKTLVGFDVDLAQALCETMGRKCQMRPVAPGDRVPGLMFRRFDVLATPTAGDVPWMEAVSVSVPYCRTSSVFLAGPGYAGGAGLDELKGKKIGAKENSPTEAYLKKTLGKDAAIRTHFSLGDVFADLEKGRVDLAFVPIFPAADFLNKHPDKGFHLAGPPHAEEGLGEPLHMAVRKQDQALLEALNAAIAKALADGTHDRLLAKYFPEALRAQIKP